MRAILVSVDYGNMLRRTLPYNRHHFDEVMVVTVPEDALSIRMAQSSNAKVFLTNAFYDDGALFNKWKALEQALDKFGRHGLMCIMDADILWPQKIPYQEYALGKLYTPVRHLMACNGSCPLPRDETQWKRYPVSREEDFAGYTQIFHAEDPHLPEPPWHEQDWKHAGGADTMFQNLWPDEDKIRTKWQVLHMGPTGTNWAGRDEQSRAKLKSLLCKRGSHSEDRFYEEKIR